MLGLTSISYYVLLVMYCFTFDVGINGFTSEVLIYQISVNCNSSEYFHLATLKCISCDQQKGLIPSENRLTCVCNSTSRISKWHKSEFPMCEQCLEGEMPTYDKKQCIPCQNNTKLTTDPELSNTSHICEECSPKEIKVQREVDGSLLSVQRCIECASGTQPSEDKTHCVVCPFNKYFNGKVHCDCPYASYELLKPDICAPISSMNNWPDQPSAFNIEYPLVNQVVQSWFFKENLRSSVYLCKLLHQEACQTVANMCVMAMYRDDTVGGPCNLFRDAKRIPNSDKELLPWLYYGEGDAPTVLSRKKITTKYSLEQYSVDNSLNLTAKIWSNNGTWLGLENINSSFLQLCPGSWNSQDAAFRFGSHYKIQCILQPKQMIKSQRTEFIELFLRYGTPSDPLLYAIPVLNKNLKQGARFPNKDPDMSQWQLVRRFFLTDLTSGIPLSHHKHQNENPAVIRYMRSCTLRVKVQDSPEEGKIYPPLLIVEYGELTENDLAANIPVHIKFEVEYNIDNQITYIMDVWIGVLCALVVIWTVLQTWSHSHRSGHLTIDLFTSFNLCIIACGNLANVFFGVISAAAIHTFVCYKGQAVAQILLPPKAMDNYINTYIIVAFVLKTIELAHMVWWQIGVDIFLIDWERPRAAKTSSQPVSIWRTYFVANEWNEIQVKRKTSLLIQLLFTLFLVKIYGLENWTRADPDLNSTLTAEMINRPMNYTLSFALTVSVYISVYIVQWLFVTALYERFIKNGIQEFVDICSLANISVFILAYENFGYYIHGRSAHGFADTDMQTIMNQLRREEEDLVGHRGLMPASDQQTFQMSIPSQLRTYYNKLVPSITFSPKMPGSVSAAFHMKISKSAGNVGSEQSATAYNNMNKFLAAFLEHALKDLDYEVRDKLFVEALFDIEFSESPGRGVLYVDNGHSFDKVLFYGNELTLVSFDLIVFCFIQMISSDILLAAIITAFTAKFVSIVRKIEGRKNLSKKSLIEERFLI